MQEMLTKVTLGQMGICSISTIMWKYEWKIYGMSGTTVYVISEIIL